MSFLLVAILAFGGAEPSGAVVDGGDALYGVTQVGGPNCISPTADWKRAGCGVVFRLAYDGSRYTVIHAFSGADGKRPIGPLVLGSDSRLYGRTDFGGADDRGVLFSLMRDGSDYRILGAGQTLEAGSPMAADAAGTLFGVSSTANVQRKIISLRDGNVRVLAALPGQARVIDMAMQGDGLLALVVYERPCKTRILRYSARGSVVVYESAPPKGADCNDLLQHFAPMSDGTLLAATQKTVWLVSPTGNRPVFTYPDLGILSNAPVEKPVITGVQPLTNGSLALIVSRAFGLNCGSVLFINRSGAIAGESVFPVGNPVSAQFLPCDFDSLLTVSNRGTLYGTLARGSCEALTGLNARPLGCGAIYTVGAKSMRIIHRFGEAIWTQATLLTPARISFSDALVSSADGKHMFVVRTSGYGTANNPFAAVLPSPQPIVFQAATSRAAVPLHVQGKSLALWSPRVIGITPAFVPSLTYGVATLPAGMYTSNVYFLNAFSERVYYPSVVAADVRPREGQQFMALSSNTDDAMITDSSARSFGTSVLTLTAVDRSSVVLTHDGKSTVIDGSYALASRIPGLVRIADDGVAREYAARYDGRNVWAQSVRLTCIEPDGAVVETIINKQYLRVSGVHRLVASLPLWLTAGGGDYAAFLSVEPLIMTFDSANELRSSAVMGRALDVAQGTQRCAGLYTLFADPWQFERMMSPAPVDETAWPRVYRDAVAHGNVIPGMTKQMVAAAIGYPPEFGAPSDFDRKDDWVYREPAPFFHEAIFKNGIVVRYDPPGQLP